MNQTINSIGKQLITNLFPFCLFIFLLSNVSTGEVLGQLSVVAHSHSFVRNYPKEEYNGANQNWAIAQDEHGVLFFGNTYGLLEFNGADWILHSTPNITFIRSVYVDTDGRIYCGSFEEFGYWQRDSYGELHYTSLSRQFLDHEALSNIDIWKIFRIGENLYLHSFSKLFIYDGEEIKIIESDDTLLPMFEYKGKPYVSNIYSGFISIDDDIGWTIGYLVHGWL